MTSKPLSVVEGTPEDSPMNRCKICTLSFGNPYHNNKSFLFDHDFVPVSAPVAAPVPSPTKRETEIRQWFQNIINISVNSEQGRIAWAALEWLAAPVPEPEPAKEINVDIRGYCLNQYHSRKPHIQISSCKKFEPEARKDELGTCDRYPNIQHRENDQHFTDSVLGKNCLNWQPVPPQPSPEAPANEKEIIICEGCYYSFEVEGNGELYCVRCQRMRQHLAKLSVGDERAVFEKWVKSEPGGNFPNLLGRRADDEYSLFGLRAAWDAWKARAELAGLSPSLKEGHNGLR